MNTDKKKKKKKTSNQQTDTDGLLKGLYMTKCDLCQEHRSLHKKEINNHTKRKGWGWEKTSSLQYMPKIF